MNAWARENQTTRLQSELGRIDKTLGRTREKTHVRRFRQFLLRGMNKGPAAAAYTSLASIHDIRRRRWRPTFSIGCSRSRRRIALNDGALALFSRIHSRAN